jgi:hypothetical protein
MKSKCVFELVRKANPTHAIRHLLRTRQISASDRRLDGNGPAFKSKRNRLVMACESL